MERELEPYDNLSTTSQPSKRERTKELTHAMHSSTQGMRSFASMQGLGMLHQEQHWTRQNMFMESNYLLCQKGSIALPAT